MNMTPKYDFHPLCQLFPPMSEGDLADLKADIETNGLRHEIVLYKGKILDGRNRYLTCPPGKLRTKEFTGDDPAAFVVSENLQRRNLTASQKAVVALDLLPRLEAEARARKGSKRGNGQDKAKLPGGQARDIAARLVGTSGRYVQEVKAIQKDVPGLIPMIRRGDLNICEARGLSSTLAKLPKREVKNLCEQGAGAVVRAVADTDAKAKAEQEAKIEAEHKRSRAKRIKRGLVLADIVGRKANEQIEQIKDRTVDLLCAHTDYKPATLDLIARKLTPTGIYLCEVRHSNIPQVLKAMGSRLHFNWLFVSRQGVIFLYLAFGKTARDFNSSEACKVLTKDDLLQYVMEVLSGEPSGTV